MTGCASSIVDGESARTSGMTFPPKGTNFPVELLFLDSTIQRKYIRIGKVFSKAYVFNKGIEELKNQARKLGAEAVINVKHNRKMSVDYLQDLYFIEGDAIVWKK